MDTKENNRTMKITKMLTSKTPYIIAAMIGLQMNSLFAAELAGTKSGLSNETEMNIMNKRLIPVTPTVATFEDADVFNDGAPTTEINVINLAPVTPSEADFEDEVSAPLPVAQELAPVTPKTADFGDQQ